MSGGVSMRTGWTSRILLLLGLAEIAWAQNQIAIPSVVTHSYVDLTGAARVVPDAWSKDVHGWDTHPLAPFILIALAALFILNAKLGPTWSVGRYWFALAALFLSVLPLDQIAVVAIPAFGLALIAAYVDMRKRAAAPVS
jgi:hypothetical protein